MALIETPTMIFDRAIHEKLKVDLLEQIEAHPTYYTLDFSKYPFSTEFEEAFRDAPLELLKQCEVALQNQVKVILDLQECHTSLLVRDWKFTEKMPRELDSKDLTKLLTVTGMVSSSSRIEPLAINTTYECNNTDCKTQVVIENKKLVKLPAKFCPKCDNTELIEVSNQFIDLKILYLQDVPDKLKAGQNATTLRGLVHKSIAGEEYHIGQKLRITGYIEPYQLKKGMAIHEPVLNVLDAYKIDDGDADAKVSKEDEIKILEASKLPDIYERLRASIAPSLYDLEEIKEGLMLYLLGGVEQILKDGTTKRGNIHVFLIGDPACLVAGERVILADGSIKKIETFGKTHLETIKIPIQTGNFGDTEIANVFHTYLNQPVIEIVTETGKSIKGSINQPLIKNVGGIKTWERLDYLVVGDEIETIQFIPCAIQNLAKTNFITKLEVHKTFHIHLPKEVDENLAILYGYIIADGWVTTRRVGLVINNEEADIKNVLNKATFICFGTTLSKPQKHIRNPKVTYYNIDRTHIARELSFLNTKRVPSTILESNNSVVSAFLRGLYEGDGCVFANGRGRTSVSLKSVNIELLRDVQLLLLRFRIHSRILWEPTPKQGVINGRKIKVNSAGNLMIRRAEDIIRFSINIGFLSNKKRAKLELAVTKVKAYRNRTHTKTTEKIVKINYLAATTVYDIEVPISHQFTANGIIVHNTAKSGLLTFIRNLMPRTIYAQGTGTSGVGLTATVTKDDLTNRWMIRPGAAVLANGGRLIIDELEKVRKREDLDELDESLESGKATIHKADIHQTMPAQYSCLAAANPKRGRFDQYKNISEQIDVASPAFLSRFDLRFILKDRVDLARDTKLAKHIMGTLTNGTINELAFPQDFLRKYILYATKTCKPTIPPTIGDLIVEKYVSIRHKEEAKDDQRVHLTPRQLEGFARLATASAKTRLSPTVEPVDVERAVRLFEKTLEDSGGDIDQAEGRPSADKRTKMEKLQTILDETLGGTMPIDALINEAEKRGMDRFEVVHMIEGMRRSGLLFEPRQGEVGKL